MKPSLPVFALFVSALAGCATPASGPDADASDPRADVVATPQDAVAMGDAPAAPGDARPTQDASTTPGTDASSTPGPDGGTARGAFGDGTSVVVYWGQNGYGGANPGDMAHWEAPLATTCMRHPEYAAVVLSFVTSFVSARNADGLPELNFAFHCDSAPDPRNPFLLRCPDIEAGIRACQSQGTRVLLSLGGASGGYGFTGDAQASAFAQTVWALFLGGSGATNRPFGTAVLDGIDLDIEGGGGAGYAAFVRRLRALMDADAARSYVITAAPQCPHPDAYLGPAPGTALGDAPEAFDAVFVQFYNNYCGYSAPAEFLAAFNRWAALAGTRAHPRVFVGLPAATGAANAGSFVTRGALPSLLASVRGNPAFGGVMLWDASYDQNSAEGGVTYGAFARAELLRGR